MIQHYNLGNIEALRARISASREALDAITPAVPGKAQA